MKKNGLAWFNIIFGALLYVGAFYVSYSHTLDLLHRGGYHNQYAHITTLVGEGVFVIGMVNLVVLQIMNKKVRFYEPPRIALWTGLIIVGYSNWSSGLGKGYESIAIGLGIVVVMWVAEAVISYGIKETRTDKQTNDTKTDTKTNDTGRNKEQSVETISRQETKVEDNDSQDNKTDNDVDKDSATHDKTTDRTEDKQTNNTTVKATTPTKRKAVDKTPATLSVIQGGKTDEDEEAARQLALDYYDTHGKYPSYRQLGELSGIGKDRAGKVIRQLKTKAV